MHWLTNCQKSCKEELDIKEKVEKKKVFDEEDVLKLMEDYTGSLRDLKRVIKWMRNKFGKKSIYTLFRTKNT